MQIQPEQLHTPQSSREEIIRGSVEGKIQNCRPQLVTQPGMFLSENGWCSPVLEGFVNLRRGSQNRSFIRAKLSIKMWFTGESTLYVLTLAKPTVSTASANSSIQAQTARSDLGRAKKRATLAQMKNCAFEQSSILGYLFSADETIYHPNQAGKAFAGLLEEDNMLEYGSQILTQFEVWG